MTDDERKQIAEKARAETELINRVKNLEDAQSEMDSERKWVLRAVWGGVVYLATKVFEFFANGGVWK